MARLFLSAVLLTCVAGAPPPPHERGLKLKILEEKLAKDRGAQCLDHSPAGYYIRHQDPNKWVIFLEGGGLCVEPLDCLTRLHTSQGSSKHWNPKQTPEGASTTSLSPLNPFANFSQVWVPYCSGDTWLGNSADGHISLLGMQMSGHLILDTVVEQLLNSTSMGSATDVILSGSSAGGIGVYHHLDWFADKVATKASEQNQPAPRVAGFPIEGMFFPKNFPVEFEQFVVGNRHALDGFMSKYLNLLQDPWLQPACVQAAKQQGFSASTCFDVSKMISYTKTPIFIAQNRFDKLQIQDIGLCFTCKADSAATSWSGSYTRFFGALQNATILEIHKSCPQSGFFVPSEFHHGENFYFFLETKAKVINGKSLRAAFESWYWDRSPVMLIEATCDDDGPCVPSLEMASSLAVVV